MNVAFMFLAVRLYCWKGLPENGGKADAFCACVRVMVRATMTAVDSCIMLFLWRILLFEICLYLTKSCYGNNQHFQISSGA